MNIANIIQMVSMALDNVRSILVPIPAILMLCTCTRRPGFSSILASAKIYADMNQNENDEIVKKFVFNVVDKIKTNLQDDGVCFVIIPPGEIKFQLVGANAGGPILLNESLSDSKKSPANNHFIFTYAIIR